MADKMFKVEIITRPEKFKDIKDKLNEIGVMGITVYQVSGCGVQKGSPDTYRGIEFTPEVLPKIKVETVVSEIPVDTVIDAACEVLQTGNLGDGKIFVYEVARVVRIRNKDEDVQALVNSVDE